MNVSSVAASSSVSYTSSSTSDTAALEKQKAKLEAELEKVSASKDNEQAKETQTKQLEQQIKQIEAQIAQKSQAAGSSVSAQSDAAPPDKPAGNHKLTAASVQEIANATTDSAGRFDIRV